MTALAGDGEAAAESPASDGPPRSATGWWWSGRSHPAFVAEVCATWNTPWVRCACARSRMGRSRSSWRRTSGGRDVFIVQSSQKPTPFDHLIAAMLFLVDARRARAPAASPPSCPTPPTARETRGPVAVSIRGGWWRTPWRWRGRGGCGATSTSTAGQLQGFFHVPVDNLHALPVLAGEPERMVRAGGLVRPVIVAPDAGRAKLARDFMPPGGGGRRGWPSGTRCARRTTSTRR